MRGPAVKPHVALLTCEALPELYEDDLLLVAALSDLGIGSRPAIWSDASIDWLAFDAVVIRSPWDYFVRLQEFRAWLSTQIKCGVRMFNSGATIEWNLDKRYLQELAAAGIASVPSIVVPQGHSPDIVALARAQGWDEIVVKPTISGGAYRTHRFRLEAAHGFGDEIAQTLVDRDLLIQPFLPEILSAGELSLLFFDGGFLTGPFGFTRFEGFTGRALMSGSGGGGVFGPAGCVVRVGWCEAADLCAVARVVEVTGFAGLGEVGRVPGATRGVDGVPSAPLLTGGAGST